MQEQLELQKIPSWLAREELQKKKRLNLSVDLTARTAPKTIGKGPVKKDFLSILNRPSKQMYLTRQSALSPVLMNKKSQAPSTKTVTQGIGRTAYKAPVFSPKIPRTKVIEPELNGDINMFSTMPLKRKEILLEVIDIPEVSRAD